MFESVVKICIEQRGLYTLRRLPDAGEARTKNLNDILSQTYLTDTANVSSLAMLVCDKD